MTSEWNDIYKEKEISEVKKRKSETKRVSLMMARTHGRQKTSRGGLYDGRQWKEGGGGTDFPLLTYTHDKFTSPFHCMAWRRFRFRTRKQVESNERCKRCNTLETWGMGHTHTQTNQLHAGRNVTKMKCNVTSCASFTRTPSSTCFYWISSSLQLMVEEIVTSICFHRARLSKCQRILENLR